MTIRSRPGLCTISLAACLLSPAFSAPTQAKPCHPSPAIDAHLGVWEGTYRYFDVRGTLEKQHRSRLTLRRECNRWIQRNEYFYPDGRSETLTFLGDVREDGTLDFDDDRLVGTAWGSRGFVLLQWRYTGQKYLNYEMINFVSPDRRMRSWQLSGQGQPTGFVQITERRTRSLASSDQQPWP